MAMARDAWTRERVRVVVALVGVLSTACGPDTPKVDATAELARRAAAIDSVPESLATAGADRDRACEPTDVPGEDLTVHLVGSSVEAWSDQGCAIDPGYFYLSPERRQRPAIDNRFPYDPEDALFLNARLLRCGGKGIAFVWDREGAERIHRWEVRVPEEADSYRLSSEKRLFDGGDTWRVRVVEGADALARTLGQVQFRVGREAAPTGDSEVDASIGATSESRLGGGAQR